MCGVQGFRNFGLLGLEVSIALSCLCSPGCVESIRIPSFLEVTYLRSNFEVACPNMWEFPKMGDPNIVP